MTTAGADLIRAMAAGDRDAFARFYDRYAALAYSVILRVVRDRPDAAEVLQEVFWEAWQGADRYDHARWTKSSPPRPSRRAATPPSAPRRAG